MCHKIGPHLKLNKKNNRSNWMFQIPGGVFNEGKWRKIWNRNKGTYALTFLLFGIRKNSYHRASGRKCSSYAIFVLQQLTESMISIPSLSISGSSFSISSANETLSGKLQFHSMLTRWCRTVTLDSGTEFEINESLHGVVVVSHFMNALDAHVSIPFRFTFLRKVVSIRSMAFPLNSAHRTIA